MKKAIFTLAVIALTGFWAGAQTSAGGTQQSGTNVQQDNPNAPEMTFETEMIDYGTIEYNGNPDREFKFKNTGKEPLIISSAVGSCGCTTPSWPKEPIKPGEAAVIKVHYDTKRTGAFEKTVTVSSNAKTPSKVLRIKGVVKPDANANPNPNPQGGGH